MKSLRNEGRKKMENAKVRGKKTVNANREHNEERGRKANATPSKG